MILAIWASVVSTMLAGIKILEMWRDRRRLTTSYNFAAPGHGGNKITIENPSKTPVMISYWELLWVKRHHLKIETTGGRFPTDEGYCSITIPEHGRHILTFDDAEYFDWGHSTTNKRKLYLKLHIVGRRKPLTLSVYDPNR
ncbi:MULTISPECIES: hypothetical protein [unclassified Bradyrhizobium]|uniref:hypothetical protein n=1 Tax=unclassified Bradyrhizobium TaxID=2631580 RepID=UPI0029165380|nr:MULTISPECIES: hypothetical protein [unclassified Bradyrhizobium]